MTYNYRISFLGES